MPHRVKETKMIQDNNDAETSASVSPPSIKTEEAETAPPSLASNSIKTEIIGYTENTSSSPTTNYTPGVGRTATEVDTDETDSDDTASGHENDSGNPQEKDGPSRTSGLSRGLEPAKIIGVCNVEGRMAFRIKWKGCQEVETVPAEVVNENWPLLVINFYESKLVF